MSPVGGNAGVANDVQYYEVFRPRKILYAAKKSVGVIRKFFGANRYPNYMLFLGQNKFSKILWNFREQNWAKNGVLDFWQTLKTVGLLAFFY